MKITIDTLNETLKAIDVRISEIVSSLERPSCYVYLSAADKAELKDLIDAKHFGSKLLRKESPRFAVMEDFIEWFKKED
jgi:hypothetical protein